MNANLSHALVCMGVMLTVSCASTKLIKEPEEIVLEQPLATHQGQRAEIALDWVLIRNGPGAWVTNADWDEYVVTVHNRSPHAIEVVGVTVTDSLGTRLYPLADRELLVLGSRDTVERYDDKELEVYAGVPGRGLAGAAMGVYALGSGAALYTLGTASASALSTGAGLAVGALVLAPVLAVSALSKGTHERRVAREITARATALPVRLEAGQSQRLDLFFPLAPSPSSLEVAIREAGGGELIVLDTTEILQGLHLESADADQPD